MPELPLRGITTWLSLLALTGIFGLEAQRNWDRFAKAKDFPVNGRGTVSPGTLEAHWTLDDLSGGTISDASGHALSGHIHGQPSLVAGIHRSAVVLREETDYIDFGNLSASA